MTIATFRNPPASKPPGSWRLGRALGLGLQGKLTLAFLLLITLALASSSYLFAWQSTDQLTAMMGQQARLVAYTLSLTAEPALTDGRRATLERIGQELLDTRNILYVAFVDPDRKPLALSKRYVDFTWSDVCPIDASAAAPHLVYPVTPKTFGEYVNVSAPIVWRGAGAKPVTRAGVATATAHPDRLLGYVVVGVSLDREQAQVRWTNWLVAAIGSAVALVSLPLAWLLVYGIFKPIRQLVEATRRISAGRLDTQVEINRDDLIGDLAASFDEMVRQVRRQREDLADTNGKLADANAQLGRAIEKLGEANRDLEQKVQVRTSQLEAANGRLSGEIAEKEDFLRAVSHDLNAPLRNIGGMATMLLMKHREQFDPDVVHRLERIQKNVEVETDLISELLELSRIKTRRQKLETVNVDTIVRDLGGVFEEDLQSRRIALVIDTPLPLLTAERARVRQVFQNLIDNAIKYMGDGATREIHVGCLVRADEAEFYVRDTGCGIEEAELGKVFNVFRRGRGSAVQNVAGKGVGLASVKSIIQTYRGTIWAESKAGQGSTFRFTINGRYVGVQDAQALLKTEGSDRRAA